MSSSGDFSAHYRYLRHLSRLTQADLAAALMPDWFRGYFRLGKIGRRVFDSLANAGLTLASLGRHE